MTHLDFREIREHLGLTQAALADRLGVDRKTVQRYEADPGLAYGRRVPPPVAILMQGMRDGDFSVV